MRFENVQITIPGSKESGLKIPSDKEFPAEASLEKPRAVHQKVTMTKTWEDPRLPDKLYADSFQTRFKGIEKIEGVEFLQFEGLNFGIPKNKIPGIERLKKDDLIEVIKLNHDGSAYGGDGIVAVSNITKGLYADFGTWQREKDKEMEELKAGATDDEHVSYTR